MAAALVALAAAPAWAVNWDHAFELQGADGIVNPAVLVGFNPQPEPPAQITELDLFSPSEPILILRDQENPPDGGLQMFDVFLAIKLPGMQVSAGPPMTRDRSMVETQVQDASGDVVFDIVFEIGSSSGGLLDPASLVGFNPQPEPPAGFDELFGMSFGIDGLSDAMVTMRVFDSAGTQLSFAAVPEPDGLALVGLGLAALGLRRRRA